MNFLQGMRRVAASLFFFCALASNAIAQTPITVVEYYNAVIASYFLTGRANEQAGLDTNPDFKRTGVTFAATSAKGIIAPGAQPICRYDVKLVPTFYSTHFYGLPTECAALQTLQLPNFNFEDVDFALKIPNAAGQCPLDAPVVVRRLFRPQTPVNTANHRYATSLATYNAMIARGWAGEGPVYCVVSATDETPPADFSADSAKKDFCEAPRAGISPRTGQAYPDQAGTRADEKDWIRYWVDRSYLWYPELPTATTDPVETVPDYFKKLKTSTLAFSGGLKDRFSFSTSTQNVDNANAGITFGYGIDWATIRSSAPREWIAAVVDPGSPAALAGVARGDKLVSVDGVNFVSSQNVTAINRGLFPPVLGESHTFVLQPANGAAQKTVTIRSASLPLISVPVSGTLLTPTGKVGYIAFTTFNSFTAEKAIADAIAGLASEGISDLVLDLRYNGGGYVYISSQLAYMVAGATRTAGKVFETLITNDKKPFVVDSVFDFSSTGSGFAGGVAAGQPLPALNLNRVFVLTTGGSCSASEGFINALRGIDVPVILIGETTCGKPYGFSGRDNCGTTYYPIQFTGVNAKNEGDYINGFAPTCNVPDDLTRPLGDPSERQLATALSYRANGVCPAGTAVAATKALQVDESVNRGSAVGQTQRALTQMKLTTPLETPRDAGGTIAPRLAKDLGEARFSESRK